jgi:hypothetical protein
MTDFYASLLVAKTVQSIRVVGNGGVAILGDPTSAVPEQNDLLTFGLSVARAMTNAGRYTRGPVRVDAAALIGMTSRDPDIGITAGVTWVLNAFRVP